MAFAPHIGYYYIGGITVHDRDITMTLSAGKLIRLDWKSKRTAHEWVRAQFLIQVDFEAHEYFQPTTVYSVSSSSQNLLDFFPFPTPLRK
jgi:hypothetical protein